MGTRGQLSADPLAAIARPEQSRLVQLFEPKKRILLRVLLGVRLTGA